VSDVSGLPQDVPERTIGAAYGDAFLAGLGTDIVPGFEALERDWVKLALELQPNVDLHPLYDAYYAVYRRLYEAAKEELHTLAALGSSFSA
jgi:xylulokinase